MSCWLFAGSINARGYGRIQTVGGSHYAHRVMYENTIGKIENGLVIDHLCRVKQCINPEHLEAVTTQENIRRGIGSPAVNARKTHCKRGHEFTDKNTYIYKGWRECRTCKRERKSQSI